MLNEGQVRAEVWPWGGYVRAWAALVLAQGVLQALLAQLLVAGVQGRELIL
jgi:hypothetical protein